jgi:hypothetical protein
LPGFSQADHVGVAPFIRLDAADKKFVREPKVIDVAQVTAFLVVPFAPGRPVKQIRIRMIMHGFGVAEELVAGRCLRQLAHGNVSHIAQHHAAAKLQFHVGRMRFLREHSRGKKISVCAPDVTLSVSLISRENNTAIISFQE